MRKNQKVVLRSKVRRKIFENKFSFAVKILKICGISALVLFSTFTVHDFLFNRDTFLVKSTEIKSLGYLTPKIAAEMKALNGRSILSFSCSSIEKTFMQKYPEISDISVHRLLPDRMLVSYSLRVPVALVRVNSALKAVDRSGKIFPSAPGSNLENRLPELGLVKSQDPANSLRFIESWNQKAPTLGLGEARLCKITIDGSNDMQAEIKGVPGDPNSLKIFWGELIPENFNVKFDRFKAVLEDLRQKSATVRSINLVGVPVKGGSVLEGREVVGRVVVELINENKG